MPKLSSHILALARKGAEHRYAELKAEISTLVKHFPGLAGRAAKAVSREASAWSAGGRAAIKELVSPRKRRKVSAKARAAMSAAQKKRWAKQKTAAGKK
jgi:hypothetical protein